ncbi:MAG TPA: BrnT family toxin [Gammaproteobacteria bacterium]|nr:BrnT family toxin [Gammaproteobacteria bacterium]
MEITFDPAKNERNIRERGLSFERAAEIDFNDALIYVDDREDYGEARYIAICYLDRRLHVLCFTETERGIRVISFRKANRREARRYGRPQALD